jgi:hypothetical protein
MPGRVTCDHTRKPARSSPERAISSKTFSSGSKRNTRTASGRRPARSLSSTAWCTSSGSNRSRPLTENAVAIPHNDHRVAGVPDRAQPDPLGRRPERLHRACGPDRGLLSSCLPWCRHRIYLLAQAPRYRNARLTHSYNEHNSPAAGQSSAGVRHQSQASPRTSTPHEEGPRAAPSAPWLQVNGAARSARSAHGKWEARDTPDRPVERKRAPPPLEPRCASFTKQIPPAEAPT